MITRLLSGAATAVVLFSSAVSARADQYVHGYFRNNGTYVQPYYRSSPNGSTFDNFSTRGNVNPYTGQPGYRSPYGNSWGSHIPTYGNPLGSLENDEE